MHLHGAPIGLFDSGEGGLTVAMELDRLLPGYPIVYACDTAHFPYGPRSLAEVRGYFAAFMAFFRQQGCRMVIVACNTATTAALLAPDAPADWGLPVVGVVEPGARAAAAYSQFGRIGVVATEATCKSGIYERILQRERPGVQVVQRACPVLVSMAEVGQVASPETRQEVAACLAPILRTGVDTLILGCTHLPHMRRVIADVAGPDVRLVDPGQETARAVWATLSATGGGAELVQGPGANRQFYCTGDPQRFAAVAGLLWPGAVTAARHLPLWDAD